MRTKKKNRVNTTVMVSWQRPFKITVFSNRQVFPLIRLHHCHMCNLNISRLVWSSFFLRMNWSNNLSKKLRNSYNAMKRLLREINI
jgi:hypothetical protein